VMPRCLHFEHVGSVAEHLTFCDLHNRQAILARLRGGLDSGALLMLTGNRSLVEANNEHSKTRRSQFEHMLYLPSQRTYTAIQFS
jgi:hypothetical protein